MKIIDDKGMLFNKINIIDFFIIVFLVCLIPIVIFAWTIFTKDAAIYKLKDPYLTVELDCKLLNLTPEILKEIEVGDTEFDNAGVAIGEILSIAEAKEYEEKIYLGDQEFIPFPHKNLYEQIAKMRLKIELKESKLFYKDRRVLIDSPIIFRTNKYALEATPLESNFVQGEWMRAKVEFSGIRSEVAKLIHIDGVERDYKDKIVAKIEQVLEIESTPMIYIQNDNVISIASPNSKDVILLLDIWCIKKKRGNYFNNYSVKIGNTLTFSTDDYSITGEIINIYQ